MAIVFQAATALGASPAQTASWMWAPGLAMGVSCIALSLHYRLPVLTAWCTAGAALLAATQGLSLAEATGAFVVCALPIVAAGGLQQALAEPRHRDAAAMTFLVSLSGLQMAGIGSAFWGLVAGSLTLAVQHWRPAR